MTEEQGLLERRVSRFLSDQTTIQAKPIPGPCSSASSSQGGGLGFLLLLCFVSCFLEGLEHCSRFSVEVLLMSAAS